PYARYLRDHRPLYVLFSLSFSILAGAYLPLWRPFLLGRFRLPQTDRLLVSTALLFTLLANTLYVAYDIRTSAIIRRELDQILARPMKGTRIIEPSAWLYSPDSLSQSIHPILVAAHLTNLPDIEPALAGYGPSA